MAKDVTSVEERIRVAIPEIHDKSLRFSVLVALAIYTKDEADIDEVILFTEEHADCKGQFAEGLAVLAKIIAKEFSLPRARTFAARIHGVSFYWHTVALIEIFGISRDTQDKQDAEVSIDNIKDGRGGALVTDLEWIAGGRYPLNQEAFTVYLDELAGILSALILLNRPKSLRNATRPPLQKSYCLNMKAQEVIARIFAEITK